ncbi:Semialdehyde dehydrogenase NAD-binding [Penicillium alfredii]|uniref:THO complex subunit 2 n=1 Tax=Penicillium alfredii TaxID=1506179 RepID=A0A9W9JXB6_9EURO|nr:Semialdehyde dehydrogenase NAD-binding [Penicillium alfredii]KAJ5084930.1 Semialdehyde dehydrogenase NAD-binding [Penicillium alfredii]
MAPGHGGKRKRSERAWSGDSANNDSSRPSPHRPGTLNMARHPHHAGSQSNQHRDQPDSRDRSRRQSNRSVGGRPSSRRGSHDGQNFPSSQQKEQGAMSPPAPNQHKEVAEPTQINGEPALQLVSSSVPNAPASQPQPRPPSRAGSEATVRRPSVPPTPYDYEYVTDGAVTEWGLTGKQKVVEEGIAARLQQDLARLASVYQELIRSAIYGRLSSADAGVAVKEIIDEELVSQDVDMERAVDRASTSELDPRSLFLDTLSIVTDADTSNPALRPLVFATNISPALMRLQLDTPLLQSLGLVRETFARMGIRKQTNLLYRQSNYNLLREESEGYSKLLTELFTTSSNEPPSSEVVEDTFEKVKAMVGAFDMDVGRVLDVTLDVFAAVLVKQYRFFVKLLRASSWWPKDDPAHCIDSGRPNSRLPNWALPGSTGWVTTEEERATIMQANEQRDREFWDRVRQIGIRAFFEIGRQPISEDEKQRAFPDANGQPEEDVTRTWIEETGALPPKGNRVAAQLLGFKLRFYSSSARAKSDVLPDNLIYLAALLIKVGFISLRDLYAHLWRPDDSMDTLRDEKMTEKVERERAARPGGGVNALMMAGALSDDTLPGPRMRESESRATPSKEQEFEKQNAARTEDYLPDPSDQKVLLLKSLLAIGAIPESLFVMSRFPWLMDVYPELPDFIHRILHHALSKVYNQLRPLSSIEDFPGQQQIPSLDQSSVGKGQIRLAPSPPRRVLRWAQLDKEDTNDGTDYRFYWDDWADSIPICQTVDDVFALCSSFLNLSGHKIGQDASLLTKLARIGKNSLVKDGSDQNKTRWRDLCKRLLLPAVSRTKENPGVVNEVFDLVSFFPRDVRYNMYAEWYAGQTSRLPDIKSAFDQARSETKDVLKRLSKTNIRPMARALAKIAFANPGIVINVAINQIESYENLIEVVVECARYFTYLGYDILTWSLINSLGQKGRSRVQEGGLLTSRWLNALATFAGRTFKRYSVMDPTPLLQYVVEQLRHNNSTDLIVLEQMISSMAGIITDNSFNDAQIQAMAGGDVLQSQTILQLLDKRHESKTTSKRLLKSLTHTRLAGQLLVAIAQERLTCVYHEESSELKLLGNIFDEIHRILTQYLDLLLSNLSVDEFDSFVPNFESLIKEFGIQPEIAFWIRRVSVSRKIADVEQSKEEPDAPVKANSGNAVPASTFEDNNKMDTADDGKLPAKKEGPPAGDNAMDVDKTEQGTDSTPVPIAEPLASNPVMQDLIDNVKSALPSETWEVVGPHFYATFWQLGLYDVHIPQKAYEDEIDRLKRRVVAINNDRSDLSMAGTQRKEREKKNLTQLQERILEENKTHLKTYGQTRARLQKEKDRWFAGMRLKHDALNVALLEQCFIPRLLLSPLDAFFSFKLLKFLHISGTPNFRTVGLLDQLFREQRLTALIFLCTSKEADNLGRFLNEILRDLTRWHADKSVYEKEAFGTKRDLPGFAKNVDPEGTPVMFLEFEDFRRLLYKWHRLLSNALKACLNGGEYMHIRNAISVLKAVVQHFPAVNWIGRDMLNSVNNLSKNDDRDDVKIPAASLIGDLNRREKKWMLPQAFNLVKAQADAGQPKTGSVPPTDASGKPGTPGPQPTTSTQLNATAAEFNPLGAQDAESAAKQEPSGKAEVEDGEIEDAKMTNISPGQSLEEAKQLVGAATLSQAESTPTAADSANAMDTTPGPTSADRSTTAVERVQTEPPVRPRPGSRTAESGRQADLPKRPEIERSASNTTPRQQSHLPRLPRHGDGRLPPRPELMDDRRDRHHDFNPRTRHGASGVDHGRSFDSPASEFRGHGRHGDRDRDFAARLPGDEPMRGPPYREGRLPREQDWPSDRPGRLRPPSDSFHGHGELMPEYPDRPGDGPRRGDFPRPDKDDRRPYPPRPLSPRSDLPNRPERFPADDHRPASFPQPVRHEDFPRGPRTDRPVDARDGGFGADVNQGRLRQPEIPSDIPSGPRGRRGGRNASGQPPVPGNGRAPTPERHLPTGSGRQSGRGAPEQAASATAAPTAEALNIAGIHPDRLKHIVQEPPSQQAPSAAMTPPSGPRGGSGTQSAPRGPSSGAGFGGERGRGDKRFAGINTMLQQSGGPVDRGGATPPMRGRGANRQSGYVNAPSPQPSGRPSLGPGPPEDDSSSRKGTGRGGDLIDDAGLESRRSGRHGDRDRERRSNETNGGGSRREEHRERGRDHDRERSRRGDVAGGAGRDEKERDREHHAEPRQSLRRAPSSREEMRRRDRRERDDGAPETGGPAASTGQIHEPEGRARPPSSMGVPPPPPPPPPPLPADANDRRWGPGDRGNRSDNRDRERERRGDRGRDRDRRDSGPGPRKRGRQGQEDHSGDGPRGTRTGDNKRPRRGA